MIQFSGAQKRFGHKLLFEGLDWLITPKDRVGIVGGNGTGKSTLLKILGGIEQLDQGSLTTMKGLTMGYLAQDGLSLAGRTVFEECLSVFDWLKALQQESEDLLHTLADLDPTSPEYAQAADRAHEIDSTLAAHDFYTVEARTGMVLDGLGFRKEDWSRFTHEFSGGWQMRIALAKLLLEQPNLLLLDEPTNHLDLEARNWLEGYLGNYPHAFVLISHDRYFLDVTVDKIVEIWNKKVWFYPGNYEKYLRQKTERREHLEAQYRNQQEHIQHLESFINRFRYQATKAKQVQSRIKELDKIERIELPPEEQTIHFSFPQPKPSGRVVAEFAKVAKSYGAKRVLENVSFYIERGDRIALVGVNGAGKSTLIKLLAGTEPLTGGEYKLGHNVEIDYFAQDQYKELNPDARLIDDLREMAPRRTETELRNLLGCFLFSDEDVFKRIGVLSGGERNRYALARLLLQPSNFLLLDEPTNHLDMRAKDVLLDSLADFHGTVVLVSHDRYFLDRLPTKVFEVENGAVNVYPGNYEDYHRAKQGIVPLAAEIAAEAARDSVNGHAAPEPPKKRVNPIKQRQMEQRVAEIEAEVGRLEAAIAEAEQELAVFVNAAETQRLSDLLAGRRASLAALVQEWEETTAAMESA